MPQTWKHKGKDTQNCCASQKRGRSHRTYDERKVGRQIKNKAVWDIIIVSTLDM